MFCLFFEFRIIKIVAFNSVHTIYLIEYTYIYIVLVFFFLCFVLLFCVSISVLFPISYALAATFSLFLWYSLVFCFSPITHRQAINIILGLYLGKETSYLYLERKKFKRRFY